MWLDQHAHDGTRRRGRESLLRVCSYEKKDRRYGEGHQKAPQISMCLLPLEDATLLEEASYLPGLRPKRNAGHLLRCTWLPCGWERAPLARRQWCWEADDGLSCDKATEISAATLLLTMVR